MKKIISLAMLVLLSSCYFPGVMNHSQYQNIVNNTGDVTYTKKAKACRPFLLGFEWGNPSVAELARRNGIREVVTVEKDIYPFVWCIRIKGN